MVPPTTLNKIIPPEKRSSLVQANSSKEKGCKGRKCANEGRESALPCLWSYSVRNDLIL